MPPVPSTSVSMLIAAQASSFGQQVLVASGRLQRGPRAIPANTLHLLAAVRRHALQRACVTRAARARRRPAHVSVAHCVASPPGRTVRRRRRRCVLMRHADTCRRMALWLRSTGRGYSAGCTRQTDGSSSPPHKMGTLLSTMAWPRRPIAPSTSPPQTSAGPSWCDCRCTAHAFPTATGCSV